MRILLASSPHHDSFGYSMPPPGLLRLGGELSRRGFEVALEDLAFRLASGDIADGDELARSAAQHLLSRSPDVLGLSVMGATLPAAVEIARIVREGRPRTRIVLGGPGTTGIDALVLARFPWFDAVVRGEGEQTLVEWLGCVAADAEPSSVPGVTWRRADGRVVREADRPPMRDLGTLPPYAWELLPALAEYKAITGEAEGLAPIDSGRGCVYDCSFCTIGRFWGRRSRPLPAARLVEEIAALRHIPGARHAYLCHDLFGANREHALELCRLLREREVRVPWECRARADHLDPELLSAMGAAGCYRVLLGIESADAGVRDECNKALGADVDLLALVDDCTRAGITPILSAILGLPGEDEAALARTLDFCSDAALRAGVNVSLHLPNPQPGCGLGEEYGATSRPLEGIPPDMAWGAGESAAERELIAAHPDLFSTWSLLPRPESELRALFEIASELPEVLARYPRTYALARRRLASGAVALFRTWKADGRSFEGFVQALRDPRIDDTLAWEQAQVRVAARGAQQPRPHLEIEPPDETTAPRPAGVVLRSAYDFGALTRALVEGARLPEPGGEQHFCVLPAAGALRGVRTVRTSADVAQLLERLDGDEPLDTTQPQLAHALERLADAGLVRFGGQTPSLTR